MWGAIMLLTPTASHPSQIFFSFIPPLEQAIRQERWVVKEKKKKKLAIQPHLKFKKSNDSELPLLDYFTEVERIHSLLGDNDASEIEDEIDWTDEDLIDLHFLLLHRSLQRVTEIKDGVEKAELLTWIFQSVIPDQVTKVIDGVKTQINIPFTFGTCCRLEGADPDVVRMKFAPIWNQFKNKQMSFFD